MDLLGSPLSWALITRDIRGSSSRSSLSSSVMAPVVLQHNTYNGIMTRCYDREPVWAIYQYRNSGNWNLL